MGRVLPPKIKRPSTPHTEGGWIQFVDGDGEKIHYVNLSTNEHIVEEVGRDSISRRMITSITEMVDDSFKSVAKMTASYSNASRSGAPVENLFYMPKELFEAVDFTDMGIVNEPQDYVPLFVKGEKYSLAGVSCEGFEMPEKIYELVGVHDEYDGIALNSVIVKQVGGYQGKIFTLSKHDCECMGIEYENGLQLFPKHLQWKRVKDVVPFNKADLGTTPVSDIDNTVRYILLKLNGFKDYTDGYVVTPSGKLIKEDQFQKTLRITSDEPIVYERPSNGKNGVRLPENRNLSIEIAYPHGLTYPHGNFISSEDTVYVLIKLVQKLADPTLIDGQSGVERVNLEGFNPNDHFKIAWDEMGAYTVEEYEAEKARREKARLERLAREEEERKKRIAEEERRIKAQRAKVEEAIYKMKNYKIQTPAFPKFPGFQVENSLGALNLYMKGLDLYFDSLDSSLTKLSNDISSMSRSVGINLDRRIGKDKMNNSIFDMLSL